MVKINDPVLGEAGLQLKNEKQPGVAELSESLQLVIDAQLFRRKLYVVSDSFTPGGVSGKSFFAEYRSPPNEGIEWFVGSYANASLVTFFLLQAQVTSVKNTTATTVANLTLPASTNTRIIGASNVNLPLTGDRFIPDRVYVPAGQNLIMTVFSGAVLPAEQVGWTMMGWSVPNPRAIVVVPFETQPVSP